MSQLPLFEPLIWEVSALNHHIRALLEADPDLQDLWVQGEISNFSRPRSGHWYFTLKDANAAIKCVMWRNTAQRQGYVPRDGDAVEVHGGISVYETGGVYQLYADEIRPVGQGGLYEEFLRLKARLEAEGLFDPQRKRPIPEWPHRIGILTSATGAALRDMLNTLRRRYPLVEVLLAPAAVQGDAAPPQIVQALGRLQSLDPPPDVILVARGGGSIEDLWAFNDERVVRAVAACRIPVISGVGHETDFTLTDFAADLRAPTPTAAAELAVPDQSELRADLNELYRRLHGLARGQLALRTRSLEQIAARLERAHPLRLIRTRQQRLDELTERLALHTRHHLQLHKAALTTLHARLQALDPQRILQRGYTLVTDAAGAPVRSAAQPATGDLLTIHWHDGTRQARVDD
ncbi:MAG: exodeoxyribonuclease VII large subunit [Anaerolineae bacterium]|nr:MAG: exodeoxyribonuclease VII large subunit [Anaerolineae bacterium]